MRIFIKEKSMTFSKDRGHINMVPHPRFPVDLKTIGLSTTEAVKSSSLAATRVQARFGDSHKVHPQSYVSV